MTTKLNNPSLAATANKNLKTKTKRAFALLMLALLAPAAAWAQSTFGGGSGTETDPYIIATRDDMDALAALVNGGNSYNGKFFKMTADLDFSGKDYTPVGNDEYGFKGTFNGNGHTISHVIIQSDSDFIGLFGLLESEGSVNGLTLGEGSSIHGFNRVGGIVGLCYGAINGCNIVEGVTISADRQSVGGIVGSCAGGNVSNCQNRAAISSNTYACGGIVGNVSSGGEVLQCSNYGSVQASEDCGGIVGRLTYCSMVTECINEGSISGDENVGGIAGFINEQSGNCFCSVSNCLNLGGVSASNSNYLGSISGDWNMGADFNNNYYAGECTIGHINGNDVAGEAMRGYAIEPQHPLGISLEGSIGVFYDGKVYAGENQEAIVGFEVTGSSIVPQCFTLSAGTYTDNGNGTYTITMPAEDITVSDNIVVEFYGTYYEIPCNGGTTATVIYDISYATLDWASIEDFEYEGVQYAVTAIADGAFDGCSDLEGVGIHAPQLATIGANAFRNCSNMTNVGFYNCATPPAVGEGAFENVPLAGVLLGVPYCSQYAYSQHEVFGQCGNIQGYDGCEYNFWNQYGEGDGLWSNPANWLDANQEVCTEVPGEGAQVAIFAECGIDVDVTVGSITAGSMDETAPVTVKTGKTLTATNYIYTANDPENLIIEDGAQVYHPNAGAQATVEKNITAYTPNTKDGYHLIGHSFADNGAVTEMTNLLANDYDLYYYDEPTHYWMNQKLTANNFTELEAAKGYLYANSASQTIGLKGTLNAANAMVNIPLSYEANALKGFNLVGNPFAHNVTTFAGTNVDTEVYRMNGTKDNVVVSEISETNPLTPGEGFFVKATGNGASITFNAQTRGGAKATELAEVPTITLNLTQNGLLVDRFILKRDGEPLEKFTLNENSTRVYATEGAQDWAVAVIASEAKQSQPVNFKAAKNGTYTLTVNMENMELDYLHLIDNLTGADVDLLAVEPSVPEPVEGPNATSGNGPSTSSGTVASYTFTAKTTDYASRFRLVFNANDASTGSASDAPFAYINNGNIIINGTGTLQIIDILGKELVRKELSTFNSQLSTSNYAPGVYVLRLVGGDSIRTQKMIVE